MYNKEINVEKLWTQSTVTVCLHMICIFNIEFNNIYKCVLYMLSSFVFLIVLGILLKFVL